MSGDLVGRLNKLADAGDIETLLAVAQGLAAALSQERWQRRPGNCYVDSQNILYRKRPDGQWFSYELPPLPPAPTEGT